MLSDEQMSKRWQFSLLNDEQMSNWVGVKHLPDIYTHLDDPPQIVKFQPPTSVFGGFLGAQISDPWMIKVYIYICIKYPVPPRKHERMSTLKRDPLESKFHFPNINFQGTF